MAVVGRLSGSEVRSMPYASAIRLTEVVEAGLFFSVESAVVVTADGGVAAWGVDGRLEKVFCDVLSEYWYCLRRTVIFW